MPIHQSAYRWHHSTKTDCWSCSAIFSSPRTVDKCRLCLLDLTAAFDTVDHELLLHRLQRTFGICGSTLAWFQSYLSDRTHCVVVDSLMSQVIRVLRSVPQGSVLGPLLFLIPRLHDEAASTSWLDEQARRALDERSSSTHQAHIKLIKPCLRVVDLAWWAWCVLGVWSTSARRASSSSQLVEPASSCKRGINVCARYAS